MRSKILLVLHAQWHLMTGALKVCLQEDLAVNINFELSQWLLKQSVGMNDVMLIDGIFTTNEYGERVFRASTCSSCLLSLHDRRQNRKVAMKSRILTKLATPPRGKPNIITASSTPISTPSSRAFVATIPSKRPSKASFSIRRRSCISDE